MFKKLLLSSICSLLISPHVYAYPQILNWQNQPVVAFENKKQAELRVNGQLKNAFAVVSGSRDQISLRLNSFDRVDIFENTKVQVLDIQGEGEFVPDFYLLEGRIRIRSEFRGLEKKDLNMSLHTPFFIFKLENEVDFYVILNSKEPSVEVRVIKGQIPLEFFSYEKKVNLQEGQSVKFVGELADDKKSVRYDFLLNNKKVPKGKLLEVASFDREQYLKADEEMRLAEQKRKKALEAQRLEKIRQQKAYEASFLCKQPFGHLDQCAWRVENGQCIRRRCNASGQWGDRTNRPMTANCSSQFKVAGCDY